MISQEIITTAKFTVAGIGIALLAIKSFKIWSFNTKQKEEPIDFNLFGRFSNMEIDGTYSGQRRRTLLFCNRLTALFYLVVLGFIAIQFLPMFLSNLGFF